VRRIAALGALAMLVAGCGATGGGVHRLHAWNLPSEAFIPNVPAASKENVVVVRSVSARRPRPAAAPDTAPAAGAPTDAEIRAELQRLYGTSDTAALSRRISLDNGIAVAPPDAPAKVQAMVAAANQVAKLPYVYGGGHGRAGPEGIWVDSAYDCSGSVSFALASAGFIKSPMVSGDLAHWGQPGPGRWVTIFANGGHAFMEIGGARFDTVGLQQSGSRWQPAYRSVSGFAVRHPPGL